MPDSSPSCIRTGATVLLAIVAIVAGGWLAIHPFGSAEVLVIGCGLLAILVGVVTLTTDDTRDKFRRWILGGAWILVGLIVLGWPGLGVDVLAPIVGGALILHGVIEIVTIVRGREPEPVAGALGAIAAIGFGITALTWPDVTVFAASVVFGVWVALFAATELIRIIRRRLAPHAEHTDRGNNSQRWVRVRHLALNSVAVALAAVLVVVSVLVHRAQTEVPGFYDWDDEVPATAGQLLRAERTQQGIPTNSQGWRILYSTRDTNDKPVIGSAVIIAQRDLTGSDHPIILWDHGTTGIAQACAPSLLPDLTTAMPAAQGALQRGWVIVAPDYPGMGTGGDAPYLIGAGEAYSALDAARAAQQLKDLSLANHIVVWGHSQGGGAALWTGYYAPKYAPELKIAGVAALSPATDLIPLARSVEHAAAGTVVIAYTITSFSNTYTDVDFNHYVRPGARVQITEAAKRCLTDPGLAASVIAGIGGQSVTGEVDIASGPLGDRLRENSASADVGGVPLLVGQGTGDEVISVKITQEWIKRQCAAGHRLDFRTYPNLTHMGVLDSMQSKLPDELLTWTADRLSGAPAGATCN